MRRMSRKKRKQALLIACFAAAAVLVLGAIVAIAVFFRHAEGAEAGRSGCPIT